MKKKWIAGILALTLLFTLTACSGSSGSGTTTAARTTSAQTTAAAPAAALEKTDFNLGYLNSTAHLLSFVAQEEGFFEEEGLRVTLTQFSSAA
ncbi:MAG: ABC transporter substrate-binding protein [Eubacteriales bacterium]|nr:ABC transporter substrate-binding protein [Eubacteriales bacterium]